MFQPISSTIALSLILPLAPTTLTNIYLTKVGSALPRTQYHKNNQHVKSHLNSADPSTLLPNPAQKPPPIICLKHPTAVGLITTRPKSAVHDRHGSHDICLCPVLVRHTCPHPTILTPQRCSGVYKKGTVSGGVGGISDDPLPSPAAKPKLTYVAPFFTTRQRSQPSIPIATPWASRTIY